MSKNLLIPTEMSEHFLNLADQSFNTFKLWKQTNKNIYLSNIKEKIDAIALMTGAGYEISAALMRSMPNLKIIGCYGVGYDVVDINYAKNKSYIF